MPKVGPSGLQRAKYRHHHYYVQSYRYSYTAFKASNYCNIRSLLGKEPLKENQEKAIEVAFDRVEENNVRTGGPQRIMMQT